MRAFSASIVLAALCAARLASADGAPARVDFTSRPEGAVVRIDGEARGVTPLNLYDLDPERRHHVRFTLDGYEPADDFVDSGLAGRTTLHADLKPVKGLLLVTSDPEGADISVDGYSHGVTPRLIDTLDARDAHRVVLKKTGYRDASVEVRFDGRIPLVQDVKLVLDSGSVSVRTEPSGAEVQLNGIPRGRTPARIGGMPKGRVTLSVAKAGYRPVEREISVGAGEEQDMFFRLEELPGRMKLASVPDGARFYIDGEAQGKGPVDTGAIPPREYEVRAELDGYSPVTRTISVPRDGLVFEEFRLESCLGSVELRTTPPGASVYIDGRFFGKTASDLPSAETSDLLTIPGIAAGERTLVTRLRGYAEAVRRIVVEPGRAVRATVSMKRAFSPDVRITTMTGVIEGELVSSDDRSLMVEVSPGIQRSIPRDTIRSVENLP